MKQEIFYNKTINKKELKSIVHSTFQSYGIIKATNLAECLKKEGFSFATQAGISISVEDLKVPPTKSSLFLKNNKQINLAYFYEKRGNINEVERFQKVIDTWHTTSELLKTQLVNFFKTADPLNPVYMMAFSGARGNLSQVRQLVGMRGLMSDPNGQIIDLPIKTNFREGLSITDYVISSYGARKGIVDTALKTADSGYLTRRLVDVAQHVIIRELDCQTKNGVRILYDPNQNEDGRYFGRVLAKSVIHPDSGKVVLSRNTALTLPKLRKLDFVTNLVLRSPLICESSNSICQKCYGWNLSQGKLVELADAVGVIAAQSIGEPGTQLTMRTFHTGGVFTGESSNQLHSALNGQILFSSTLQTSSFRTIYGETIFKAVNNSEFFIFDAENKILRKYLTKPEMLLFVNNKSIVTKGDLLAELPLTNKRTTRQLNDIFAPISGEVQFQNVTFDQKNALTKNGLIWLAAGEIYDILPSMLIKKKNRRVKKNNAVAQTKVVSPIGGIVKLNKSEQKVNNYIVAPPSIFRVDSIFKTINNQLFLLKNNDDVFSLKFNETNIIAYQQTNKFSLLTSSICYYSRTDILENGQIQNLTSLLFLPYVNLNEANRKSFLIDNTSENAYFDKKILYPGEIIFNSIEILDLSYCQFIKIDSNKIEVTILPLKQGIVSKPKAFLNQILDYGVGLVNSTGTYLSVPHNSLIKSENSFCKTILNLSLANVTQTNFNLQFIKLKDDAKKRLALVNMYKIPINLKNLNKNIISYLTQPNQIIEAYSIIATSNIVTSERLSIKNFKNQSKNPNRFLISSSQNYKEFSPSINPLQKFFVVGDKFQNGSVADYSGYLVDQKEELNKNIKIRISSPFFISQGTNILVQHGSLIKKDESLCQLVSTRVISDDIVTGLPRIEQLLESRLEKNPCELIERPGIVKTINTEIISIIEKKKISNYKLNFGVSSFLKKGELVSVAQPLDTRLIHPHNVLKIYFQYYCAFYSLEKATKLSIIAIQILLLNLVQDVYRSQGIYISDKHVEIIVRQITSKVKILKVNNETTFTVGEIVEFEQILYINQALRSTNLSLIEYEPILLGITKVSLSTESFISAASFQETTRILTQAAVEGKVEWLRGLKENVILGRLVPAGTGFKAFNSTSMLNISLA